jgi:hypothetical protein
MACADLGSFEVTKRLNDLTIEELRALEARLEGDRFIDVTPLSDPQVLNGHKDP